VNRHRVALVGFVAWFFSTACTPPNSEARPAPRADTASSQIAAPARIISQTVLSDEVLSALGPEVRARVVGVSRMADDRRYSQVRWPMDVPRVGATAERLLALDPDLTIVASFTAEETHRMLERAGVPRLTLTGFSTFDDYRRSVRAIGAAVGAEDKGADLVAAFDARLESIEARRPPAPWRTVVSWEDGAVPGSQTTFDDAARSAGLENLAARELAGHGRVSMERLVAWDPELIVIACKDEVCDDATARFLERPGAAQTKAGRTGGVLPIAASALYATGSGMLELVQALSERADR
jgi:iron complex transport system substrate-binding protein